MKVIVAGSRSIDDYRLVATTIKKCPFEITEIVSGCARGVDLLGERWAQKHHVPIKRFPADWGQFGKYAGYRRNKTMGEYCDAAVIIWDGWSRGAKHMLSVMHELNKPYFLELCTTPKKEKD